MNDESTAYAETILCAGSIPALVPEPAGPGDPGACVAISGGRILEIGGAELMERRCGPGTEVHDFGSDAAILPGLVDGHTHPVWGSESTGGRLAMSGVASLAEARTRLAEAVAATPADGRVTGYDFDVNV